MKTSSYISLQKIAKTYEDGYLAIQDVNLDISRGEFVTLLGPSGCGKTTILKMIAGFSQPTEGRIIIDGLDVKDLPPNSRPTATVFQDYALFPSMTVLDNIKYGIKLMRTKKEVSKDITKELAELKVSTAKKSEKEKKELTEDLEKNKKELEKLIAKYDSKPEWQPIKNMRWNQYETRVLELQEKKRKQLKDEFAILDKSANPQSTKYDLEFLQLKKDYYSKIPLDKAVDKMKKKIQSIDSWISYWDNYTMLQTEKFEKKYTTRKLTRKEINDRAYNVIKKVGLEGKEYKYPNELSGGMQQRVALARAIVIEPEIILLDEPLSALDAKVRREMQYELKRLHNELKLTFILVTHDQEEALTLSTKIVVMSRGKVRQVGTPMQVYEEPTNHWVANFIGNANFFNASWISGNKFKFANTTILCDNKALLAKVKTPGEVEEFMIRPEDIDIVPANKGFIKGVVEYATYQGLMYEIKVKAGDMNITVSTTDKAEVGQTVGLKWNPEDIHFLMPMSKGSSDSK